MAEDLSNTPNPNALPAAAPAAPLTAAPSDDSSLKRPFEENNSDPIAKRQFVGDPPAKQEPAAPAVEETSLKIVVSNAHIGNVIGKKGAVIKGIRESTGARVNVSDSTPYGADRIVTLRGTYEQVQHASAEVNKRVEEAIANEAAKGGPQHNNGGAYPQPGMPGMGGAGMDLGVGFGGMGGYQQHPGMYGGGHQAYGPETELKLLVPNGQAGGIIGKGGCTIKEIREKSGARIKMAQASEMPVGSTERLMTITGPIHCVQTAQHLISQKLAEIPDSTSYGASSGFGNSGFGGASAAAALQQAGYSMDALNMYSGMQAGGVPPQSVQVSVPNDSMGRIIGRGGSSINEIRQVSGCRIDVADLEPGATARVVTITGTPEQAQMAQYLISVKMMQSQQYEQ